MRRGGLALLCACLLFSFAQAALADEVSSREAFREVQPTRSPNAPEYFPEQPGNLVSDQLVARSFILLERSTGEVLMSRDEDNLMYPASTTKILTALVALKYGELDDEIVVSQTAVQLPESDVTVVPFKVGERITLKDCLYGLLVKSGNDAANIIAEHISGDISSFVALMNEEARQLGCTNTHFTNAHGLHDDAHYTTARDLAIMMNAALDHPVFREMISTVDYTLPATPPPEGNPARNITNTNLHIQPSSGYYFYPYSIGGKTGYTFNAGYNLVDAAAKDGVELIAVAMYTNEYARWSDTTRLFEYGFSKYDSTTPEEIYAESPTVLAIKGFDVNDALPDGTPGLGEVELSLRPVDPERKVRITDRVENIVDFKRNYAAYTNTLWLTEFRAPVEQGQVMGILTFYPDNEEPAEYELIATRSVAARLDAPPTLEEIERRVEEDPSLFPPFDLDWAFPPLAAALAAALCLRALIKAALTGRRGKKQIPKPSHRYFS